MRKAKKAVRKAAEGREKAAQSECMANDSAHFEKKDHAASTPESLLEEICEELTEEARFALQGAVMFEHQIIYAAILLGRVDNMPLSMRPHELFAWVDKTCPTKRLKLHKAISIVAKDKNLCGEIPDLGKDLKQGEKARNLVIHDAGHAMGRARLAASMVLALSNTDWTPTPMILEIVHLIGDVKKMREEISQFLELSSHVQKLALEKLFSAMLEYHKSDSSE